MNRLAIAVAFVAASLPALAAACSPMWYGQARVTHTDAPACLTFEGQRTEGGMGYDVEVVAINDCDTPAMFGCSEGWCDDGRAGAGGAEFEVPAGGARSLFVQADGFAAEQAPLTWRLGEESGTVEYTEFEGCGMFCQASPGTGGGSAWWGLALLALVGLRRLR